MSELSNDQEAGLAAGDAAGGRRGGNDGGGRAGGGDGGNGALGGTGGETGGAGGGGTGGASGGAVGGLISRRKSACERPPNQALHLTFTFTADDTTTGTGQTRGDAGRKEHRLSFKRSYVRREEISSRLAT